MTEADQNESRQLAAMLLQEATERLDEGQLLSMEWDPDLQSWTFRLATVGCRAERVSIIDAFALTQIAYAETLIPSLVGQIEQPKGPGQ